MCPCYFDKIGRVEFGSRKHFDESPNILVSLANMSEGETS